MNNVVSGVSRIMNQLQVVLSIMVRYGILVFAAVLRREAAERVAKPGPFQETAPVGLRRKGCTALAAPFSGKRSEFRSTQQARAARNVWSTTKQSRIWAACGLRGRKKRALSAKGVAAAARNWTSTMWTKNFNHAFGDNVWQQADRQAMCGRPTVNLRGDRPGAATHPPTYFPAIRAPGIS